MSGRWAIRRAACASWLLAAAATTAALLSPAEPCAATDDGGERVALLAQTGYETDADDFNGLMLRGGALWGYRSYLQNVGIAVQDTHYSQGAWSKDVPAVIGIYRDQEPNYLTGLRGELGVADVSGSARPVGDIDWSVRPAASTGVELIAAGDVVGTREAIERGISYGLLAGSVEQQFGSRLTGIALVGWQPFTDSNSRTLVRARLIFSLLPEDGVSMQFRWRQYASSKTDVNGAYFNPNDYRNWDAGLSVRRHIGGWVVYGLAGGGQERINEQSWQGTAIAELRAEGPISGDMHLAVNLLYNRAAGFSNAPDYWYGAVNVSLIVPLGR